MPEEEVGGAKKKMVRTTDSVGDEPFRRESSKADSDDGCKVERSGKARLLKGMGSG